MKVKDYILKVLLLEMLLIYITDQISCPTPYQPVPYGTQSYCIKCDSSCLTCSDQGLNNCVTCPTDFTFDSINTDCQTPDTALIKTLQSSYKFYGFSVAPGWNGGSATNYGFVTVLSAGSGGSIYKQYSFDSPHYKYRVLVSGWWLSGSSQIICNFYNVTGLVLYKTQILAAPSAVTSNQTASSSYTAYPIGSLSTNFDFNFADSYDDNTRIQFTSSSTTWGIRQFILIEYLCNVTYCSRCDGPNWNDCLECSDSHREIVAAYPKQCRCNSTMNYFQHPYAYYCVNPCPSMIQGRYYGDPITKHCRLNCSDPTYFADPVTGQCSTTCTAQIDLGNVMQDLYYDTTNMICTTLCPSNKPYIYPNDRTCYMTCPNSYYQNDQTMTCVQTCPSTGPIPLFGYNGACIDECIGVDLWADFVTSKCVATCANISASRRTFQDNSTGRHLCVQICPFPDMFGDYVTIPAQPECVQTCPDGYYGDYTSPRHCVTKCSNGYGLKNGTRACVPSCPSGTWAEDTNKTCLQEAIQCGILNQYADNATWACVNKGACSNGMFSLTSTYTCEISCPNNTYAYSISMHCQLSCSGSYFADPGVNKCVQVCQTQDLYSDVSSGNLCVSDCNQTGTTPFRDPSTKKCVNQCPDTPYYFADPQTHFCALNCTPGSYADSSIANKTCKLICPSDYFADNSTGYGVCVQTCPEDPPLFGDVIGVNRLCVSICQTSKFGDQSPGSRRFCGGTCPTNWFAQDDSLRRCVTRCNSTTYGYLKVCYFPQNCPVGWVGDPSTSLCTNLCPASLGLFKDKVSSHLCVSLCPTLALRYFADPTNQQCVTTCDLTNNLYGNNNTRTCESKCLDLNSYADAQSTYRYCTQTCTNLTGPPVIYFYRNNFTKTCVISTDCPDYYFADNSTMNCVAKCPIVSSAQTWGHIGTQTCVNQCYGSLWGDTSTNIPLCIPLCPSVPAKWSNNGDMTCVTRCPNLANGTMQFGEDFTRTCTQNCPTVGYQTFAYQATRRCLKNCPNGTFGDWTTGICYYYPENCTFGWGNYYNTSCTNLCTGPTPWDTFGDNSTHLCQAKCIDGFADNYTGGRTCIDVCPGTYNANGVSTGTYNTYGDNDTKRCVLYCLTPNTYADWQTHLCQTRCSGDNSTYSTYAANMPGLGRRCVIALTCPISPDLLYGDNNTRTCVTSCQYAGVTQWADNVTRTCVPQCLYILFSASLKTRYYGDTSTGAPICVISCPTSPRMFGQNVTNLCFSQCPDDINGTYTYGDQVNNRSCVYDCYQWNQIIYYSQITQRLCVSYCEDGTFANWHNRHCQTVSTDCIVGQYANDGNNSCVALCPQSLNYFGYPPTRTCVPVCSNLTSPVLNETAQINETIGLFFADYSTRLCVRTCPADYGPVGTFGDVSTMTCVQRCPIGTYGDSLQTNRLCVQICSANTYADDLSQTCVSQCPSSPPSFAHDPDWTCVKVCPSGYWANSQNRSCVSTCPNNTYRLSDNSRSCVNICPSYPDLYADTFTNNCSLTCSHNYAADPTDRKCKQFCLPLFQYNKRCVKYCPVGYYANSNGDCVTPKNCDNNTYGDNATTTCIGNCPGGSFADPNSRYCIQICPEGWFGDINQCVTSCQTNGTSASNISQMCRYVCPNLTYSQNNTCVQQCSILYSNDQTGSCEAFCPNTPIKLFANPINHDCDSDCQIGYVRDYDTGYCVQQNLGCSNGKFADPITLNCVDRCSEGYWGNLTDRICYSQCPLDLYGYDDGSTERTCYLPADLPLSAPQLFADPESGQFISVCQTAPVIYFGDRNRKQCVTQCQSYLSTNYYGDPNTRQCEPVCTNNTFYTADPNTFLCTLKCTLGFFRYNNTPICVDICPSGYADSSTRICVQKCPALGGTFGFFNITSLQRLCVQICPADYYSQPISRTCNTFCSGGLFADNGTNTCVSYCVDSFADSNNWRCVSQCLSVAYPNADNSTNKCVLKCPSLPDYYSDNHVCVYYCTQTGYYADPHTRTCVSQCPNVPVVGANPAYVSYGDPLTKRCTTKCSQGYWGQNSTNLCVKKCLTGYADNLTRVCVSECPVNQSLYADSKLRVCAYTCSGGFFGSQINQTCIQTCELDYWGDPTTTLCVQICPDKIYSYGENVTRKCVSSCIGYTGYADNFTRLCRDSCQNVTTPETFANKIKKACVQICPDGYFAQNSTQQCLDKCLTGFADNYSRYCVLTCPDDPETYGDSTDPTNHICLYQCLNGYFTDNSTNLCVFQCPSYPDYYGDTLLKRCVYFCSQGSYAQNDSRLCQQTCPLGQYADNLTRRCVSQCPTQSQGTYKDYNNKLCVRICPEFYWAQNITKSCVNDCPVNNILGINYQTYEDNISKFCVSQCPYPFFGQNSTHQCTLQCSTTLNLYGHPEGRVCVSVNDCYQINGTQFYSDPSTRTCVQKCPLTLWANDNLNAFTCVLTCDSGWFRDLNTQKCVQLCSTNPPQYSDSIYTYNCVSKCPNGYYAYQTATVRDCVTAIVCASHLLYADNQTNRCVTANQCTTDPFMYSDINAYKCVFSCSNSWFLDNKTKSCVSQCPSDWQLFGDTLTHQCVQLCPDGYYADALNSRLCSTACSNGQFADNDTSTCVTHCFQIKPYYYQDTSTGKRICVDQCPGQSYGYNPTQKCMYQNINLSSSCPSTYYADRISKQCTQFCPEGTYANLNTKYCQSKCSGIYFADNETRTCKTTCSSNYFAYAYSVSDHRCVQFCPYPYYAQNSSKSCVGGCSLLLSLQTTRTCQTYCPQPYFAYSQNNQCVMNCTPYFADSNLRKCIPQCNAPEFGNKQTMTCDLLCPEGYFGRQQLRACELTCLPGSFADLSTRLCVDECPSYPLYFADNRTNQCVSICFGIFAYEKNRTCLYSCPNDTINGVDVIYLADSFNHKCVLHCISQEISFADYWNNQCTDLCPNTTYANNQTKQCVEICPNIPDDTFAQNNSRICMDVCPTGSYGSSEILHCVASCWWPNYADSTTNLCVQVCPLGYFARNQTATCNTNCSANSYAQPNTRICVSQCPILYNLFKYDQDWTCVAQCPITYYSDQNLRKCVKICTSNASMYAYDLTRQCVRECPVPYRGYDINHTCILNCPSLYFYNITRNVCTRCPIQCLTCTSPTACLSCIGGYNLFNGICNISCKPTATLITYANPSGVCVAVCPYTYFGDNSTYSCTQTCPSKQYGSTITQLCQNCPQTCSLCTSPTYCTACQSLATLAIDHMCYSNCNSTHKYYFDGTCFNVCPDGTFISFTNVNCTQCSGNCFTCSDNATNCLSCTGKYFYQNTCLTSCPSGYFGNTSFICENCNTSANASICAAPLNFTTTVSVQNFQYVVYVKFNQQVSIQKQIEDLLKINLKMTRRLLDLASLINNGISYTYEILPDGTIKLYLIIQQSLSNPQFSVQILDPTAVVSLLNGGPLQNTQSTITIAQVLYYSPSEGTQAQTNMAARFAMVFILLLYALSFLWTDAVVKSIQFMQLFFFHAMINTQIPASLYYYLIQLKISLLKFMPNYFRNSISQNQVLHKTYSQKIIDTIIDYDFLRNIGQIFFFITIFGCLWLIFLFLSNKRLISHKVWHNMFQSVFKRRFKFMVVNDFISLFYIPILWFAFNQFQDLGTGSYMIFNSFCSILFLILTIFLPILYLYMWWKREGEQFQQSFSFLCKRLKNKELSNEIYSQASQQKLKNGYHNDKQKQDEKVQEFISNQYKNPNPKHRLQVIATNFYLILCSIWLVGLYDMVVPQQALLIITNLVYLIYILSQRPYINMLNTGVIPIILSSLIVLESYFIYFELHPQLTSTEKTNAIAGYLIYASIVFMIMIIWSAWRCVWDLMDIWNFFTKTQFYLIYADPHHEVQQQQSQNYQKYEPKIQIDEQPQLGDVLVQKIYKQCNQAGQSVIRIKKKVLKKKKKVERRKKKDNSQPLYDEEGNIIKNNQPQSEDQDLQFVRINQVNLFDYGKKQKEQQKKIIKQKTAEFVDQNKRVIDDDIRDQISQESDYYNDKISSNLIKGKNSIPQRQNQKQKIKVQVQPEEDQIINLQDLGEDKKDKLEQNESQQPFEFISDLDDENSHKDYNENVNANKNSLNLYQQQKKSQKNQVQQYQMLENSHSIAASQIKNQLSQEVKSNIEKEQEKQISQEKMNEQQNKKQPKVKENEKLISIEDLLFQEENKKKKLMFLFDDFQEQSEENNDIISQLNSQVNQNQQTQFKKK